MFTKRGDDYPVYVAVLTFGFQIISQLQNILVILRPMMKQILCLLVAMLAIAGCRQSHEEKQRIVRKQRIQLLKEDSAALKIAVMPTLDCLPLFVAKERQFFSQNGADVRLKMFTAQMDCDTAIMQGRVEGMVSDLVRTERMQKLGIPLTYVTSTNAYWQLYANRLARLRKLPQLDDKMLAMTRYSVTDLMADFVADSAKLSAERLFKIQINDVHIRLKMLTGNEIDAVLLTEPQATQARLARHNMLLDSRKVPMQMGVIAFREEVLKDTTRQRQLEVFKKSYNQACDSLARYGIGTYRSIVAKYCKMPENQVDSLPRGLKFPHIAQPADADIERAKKWLDNIK